jgi:hypothetical protein
MVTASIDYRLDNSKILRSGSSPAWGNIFSSPERPEFLRPTPSPDSYPKHVEVYIIEDKTVGAWNWPLNSI